MKKLITIFLLSQFIFVIPSFADKTDKLIDRYEQNIKKEPKNIDNYTKLGDLYLNNYKDTKKALEYYYKGINDSEPKIIYNSSSHKKIIDFMSAKSNNNKITDKNFENSFQQLKKISELYLKISIIYSDLKDNNKQESTLLRGIEINPSDWRFYNNLANLYKEQKHFDKAINMYNQALAHAKDYDYLVKLNIGNTYSEMNETDKALSIYKSILKTNPELLSIYYSMAVIYINKNDSKEAIEILKALLMREKNNTEAIILITATYLKEKNYDEAIRFLDTAIDKKNQAGFYYKLVGEIYRNKGDIKSANENFALSCENGELSACNN